MLPQEKARLARERRAADDELRARQLSEDLAFVLNAPQGRRVMRFILRRLHGCAGIYRAGAEIHKTAALEDEARELERQLQSLVPESFEQLVVEGLREQAENLRARPTGVGKE